MQVCVQESRPRRPAPTKLAGTLVGRYTIVSKLGRGGQGVVYLAHDAILDRPVALKFLPPALADDDCARERFAREALTAAAVQHPNICAIYAIETTDEGQPFIAMAYCKGVTLKRALNDGVLSIVDAIDVAAQIAEGLSAAHAHGVVHRNVKPGNVMLTDLGVKILDFGLARFIDSSQNTAADGCSAQPRICRPSRSAASRPTRAATCGRSGSFSTKC